MRKRILIWIFVVLLLTLFAGCTARVEDQNAVPSDDSAVSDISIVLEENPSTGYSWSYTVEPEGMLREKGSMFVPGETGEGEMMTGVPGKRLYSFEPLADGKVTLTFQYAQAWEGGDVGQTLVYEIEIRDGEHKILSQHDDSAVSDSECVVLVKRVYLDGDRILAELVEATPEEGTEESALAVAADAETQTLVILDDAVIEFSPDFSPQTQRIAASDFVEKFNEANLGEGFFYTAVISGDAVSRLEFFYTE